MSEPQLISPLLDGFVMGDPISSHDGVRACPAVQLDTDEKYIVKIISLPATQSQLDALLLAGAFTDRESAVDYFKELADGVLDEAALLQKLSRNVGFVSFKNWQIVPMEDNETGFDIYLLSQYRPTLDSVFRANEMTHLQAINLGLDLCAALSASRRAGYLYSNLRPSNIYICNDREFRIGDLGFLSLDSLAYASLPDKYHSDYTPPEICDAYSSLNNTMDTYAVGLILYQAYNDGRLPPVGMPLDAPRHADPALAEIILKACAVDPAERWQDPAQMGQTLAAYMQANTVNDTPIVPPPPEEDEPEIPEEIPDEDPQPSTDDILAEVDEALDNAPPIIPSPAANDEDLEEATSAENPDELPAAAEDETEAVDGTEERTVLEAEQTGCEDTFSAAEEVLDETTRILAQADDLIAHQLPDPPVAPEPIEVTLPDPEEISLEMPEEAAEDTAEETAEPEEEKEEEKEAVADEELTEEAISEEIEPVIKKNKGLKTLAIVLAAVLLLMIGSFLFIRFYYLQTIDGIALSGTEDRLTVTLTTETDDSLLSVLCTDTHGNTLTASVKDGVAEFTGLKSSIKYSIEVRISGFHKLLGETTDSYTAPAQTQISNLYAVTALEDGSVTLSFTSSGPSSEQWTVTYHADGEESKQMTFTGHVVTLTGLVVGKEYTFTLEPVQQLYLTGSNTVTYTVSKAVYAENIKVLGYEDGNLMITWECPEDVTVAQWHIQCYNDAGFIKNMTANETKVAIDGLEIGTAYTVAIRAEAMAMAVTTSISANTGTVTNFQADASDLKNLKVTWDCEGTAPAGGWLLTYSVDGSAEKTISCSQNVGTITPLIPGAHYTITVKPADNTAVFGGDFEYDAPAAPEFDKFEVTAENMEFSMCKTPSKADWTRKDVPSGDYTTAFPIGTSASFVMHLDKRTSKVDDVVTTLCVIRDLDGNLVGYYIESRTWDEMWDDRYGTLTIPVMPELAGHYTAEIYFDGAAVLNQKFTVTTEG